MKLFGCVLLTVAFANVFGANVFKFEIEKEERVLYEILKSKFETRNGLGTFRYKNCGDPTKDLLHIESISIGPDPLSFPGTLDVSFQASIKSTIDAPIKVDLIIERQIGSSWLKIPCIDGIGSCVYDDLCATLQGATCPDPFIQDHIPCKCPFSKGMYKMSKAKIAIDAAVFPPGNYHFKGDMTNNEKHVGCVELYASFE